MPAVVRPCLDGELMGVLAGDLIAMALDRVEAVSDGEALTFLVRAGAMIGCSTDYYCEFKKCIAGCSSFVDVNTDRHRDLEQSALWRQGR